MIILIYSLSSLAINSDKDKFFKTENPNYNYYHSFFEPHKNHKIIGEATPIYMYWKNTIKRIYNYNSDMKLILVLRNPINRAFSHWNMEVHRKRENRTFWKAINEELENHAKSNKQHRTFSYLDRGFYSIQIAEILGYYNRKQVLIIRNKSLRENLNGILKQVSSTSEEVIPLCKNLPSLPDLFIIELRKAITSCRTLPSILEILFTSIFDFDLTFI